MTSSTCSRRSSPSGVTISRVRWVGRAIAIGSALSALKPLRLLEDLLDRPHHVEGLLGDLVQLAGHDHLEAADGVLQGDVLARDAGELLGHVKGLGEELLDLPGPGHRDLVVLAELVDPQDGDDVLEVLVALKDLLHVPGRLVVLFPEDAGVEDARRGGEGIHRGVDPELHDLAREHRGGVQVREGGGRSGVSQVVGGDVDRLHGGDRALLGRGDPLLELAHLGLEGGLIAHRGRHAPEEGGHFGPRLGEPEDVVDEEEDVLALVVAEVLGHGEAGEGDPQAGPGGLRHLAVDERGLGARQVLQVDDLRLLELQPEVVPWAGAGRWMGWRFSAFTGPSSSTGSPITLSTRPRVAGPTGTMMGPPVSVAFIPRTMPSVGSMETQRARFSPMCCSTSAITSMAMPLPLPSSWMRTALWMGGMAWSNSTSTTGPMICTTRPTFSLAASFPAFVIDPPPEPDQSSTPPPILP